MQNCLYAILILPLTRKENETWERDECLTSFPAKERKGRGKEMGGTTRNGRGRREFSN